MPTRSLRHKAARARRRRRLLLLMGSALGLSAAVGGSVYYLVSGHRLEQYLASSAQTATTLGDARPCPVVGGTVSPAAAGSPAAASPGAASPGPPSLTTSHKPAGPAPASSATSRRPASHKSASHRPASPAPGGSATSRRSASHRPASPGPASPGPGSFTASPAPGSRQPAVPLADCPQAPALVGPGSATPGSATPGSATPARPPGRPLASPSPSPTPARGTPPAAAPSPAVYTAIQQVLTLLNQTRIRQELPPYTLSKALSRSAARHTALMAAGCGLSHQCPGEPPLGARETAAGARWTAAGENIGEGGPEPATAAAIAGMATTLTQDMLNERAPDDGHRRNLLSSTFRRIGIAIVRDSSGDIWLTQDFSN